MPLTQDQQTQLHLDAINQLGKPYLWGPKPNPKSPYPQSFDCSGFIYWCYGRLGITVPEGSEEQKEASIHIDAPSIGDIAFFVTGPNKISHHVGMLLDESTVIEARGDPQHRVITRSRIAWEAWHEFLGWQRFKVIS